MIRNIPLFSVVVCILAAQGTIQSAFAIPQPLNPPSATNMYNAKYAICKDAQTEFFVDFSQSDLSRDDLGMVSGSIGPADFGYRQLGSNTDFKTMHTDYPSLISNGPSTTIVVYDYGAGLNIHVKSYDFITGEATGTLNSMGATVSLQCAYFQSPFYKR